MAWRAPSAEEENGDGDALAGRRVRVAGFGEGTVLGFRRCVANHRGSPLYADTGYRTGESQPRVQP